MSNKRRTSVYIPVELFDELLILCEKEYRSMNNLINVAIRDYVENNKGGEKIMTREDFINEMSGLGFSNKYINYYLKEMGQKEI